MNEITLGILVILAAIVLIALWPLAAIWSLNTLFGLHIPMNASTWLATVVLVCILRLNFEPYKKK
jgi:hypothetical protein